MDKIKYLLIIALGVVMSSCLGYGYIPIYYDSYYPSYANYPIQRNERNSTGAVVTFVNNTPIAIEWENIAIETIGTKVVVFEFSNGEFSPIAEFSPGVFHSQRFVCVGAYGSEKISITSSSGGICAHLAKETYCFF